MIGGSLLLAYTCGYVAPLLAAASLAGAIQVSSVSENFLPRVHIVLVRCGFINISIFSSPLPLLSRSGYLNSPRVKVIPTYLCSN